jgi:glucose-1-phosphate cytidylyltransferase
MKAKNLTTERKTAVILCGGRGSRMGDATEVLPKPLLEVHGKPILWYSFWTLYGHGFRTFILPLGYRGQMIESYIYELADGLDCEIYCVDTGETTPIAQRISQVQDHIPDAGDFFLLNSDTIFEFDIEAMLALHREADALVTLSSVEVVSTWGLIIMDGDRLAGFDRQRKVQHLVSDDLPGKYGLVNSGLAWLNKDALAEIELGNCDDLESTLYQHLIDIGRATHFKIRGDWFPIDTPKDLRVINLAEDDRHGAGHMAKAVHDKLSVFGSNSV